MKLADVSVRRPVFAVMMSLALLVLGWFSYRQLGLDLMPKTDYPTVTVSAGLPGANLLTKGLLGFAAGTLSEQLDCENPNTQAIVSALATLLQGAVHLALLEVFSAGTGVLAPFLGTIAPAAALNGALLPAATYLRRAIRRGRRFADA